RFGIEGVLARATDYRGLHFAAKTELSIGDDHGVEFVRGTLAAPAKIESFVVTGEVGFHAAPAGLRLATGTLAKPAVFEAWTVPAGTKLTRFEPTWSFTVPHGTAAHPVADHLGHRIDAVTEARFDDAATTFMLAAPFTPKGTHLAFINLSLDHTTG